jgi:hypothetical protein
MGMVKHLYKQIILLILFMAFCGLSNAKEMGTVDTRILLMLHPGMINYDYSNGRFFRDSTPEKNIEKVLEQLKEARRVADEKNATLNKEIKGIEAQKFELLKLLTREEQYFAPGDLLQFQKDRENLKTALKDLNEQEIKSSDAASLVEVKKADLQERIKILDDTLDNLANLEVNKEKIEKHRLAIAELDVALIDLADQIRKNEEEAVKVVYLTTEETDARLAQIKAEIKTIIDETANEANIALVIDNSFAMRTPERKRKGTMIPAVDESPDVVSAALFHSLINFEIDKELEATLDVPVEGTVTQHLIAGRSTGLETNLKQYLEFRNYMPQRVAGVSTGNIFLSGGVNLTPSCARKLFEKYNVPEAMKQRHMQILRSFMDFESNPFFRERDY